MLGSIYTINFVAKTDTQASIVFIIRMHAPKNYAIIKTKELDFFYKQKTARIIKL